MNPLYFGSSQKPLYGVYHPPKSQPGRPVRTTGVVLCYPLGQEYMRAHRAFRQLATLLTKSGFPVLRFDYYGTGDSGGDGDAGDVDKVVLWDPIVDGKAYVQAMLTGQQSVHGTGKGAPAHEAASVAPDATVG